MQKTGARYRNLTADLNRAPLIRPRPQRSLVVDCRLPPDRTQPSGFSVQSYDGASSLVICSDAELMRLADERQEAIKEARTRIGEDRWPALWDNQKAWVRSYSAACGVPADRQPPAPVPEPIRDCFKKAALERIALLRAYGNGNTGRSRE